MYRLRDRHIRTRDDNEVYDGEKEKVRMSTTLKNALATLFMSSSSPVFNPYGWRTVNLFAAV